MGWKFYNSSGQQLSTAATSIDVLDIDGATDINAAIVDADLFIIDDGAGGTNRKTTAARIKTYAAVTEATQAVLEEDTPGSSTPNTYISPEVAHFHPGVAKVWCQWDGTLSSSHVQESYNTDGFTDHDGGSFSVDFAVDFATDEYASAGMVGGTNFITHNDPTNMSVGSAKYTVVTHAGAGIERTINAIVIFGDQ